MTLIISTLFLLAWKLGSSEPRVLQVYVSPIFHSLSPPMKLHRQIQLSCDVTADPPIDVAQIRWLADAVTSGYIKTNRKYTLNTQPSSGISKHVESILTINKISQTELGRYSCEARNSAGMYKRVSVSLTLAEASDDILVQDGGYTSGQSESFVHASGRPLPDHVTTFPAVASTSQRPGRPSTKQLEMTTAEETSPVSWPDNTSYNFTNGHSVFAHNSTADVNFLNGTDCLDMPCSSLAAKQFDFNWPIGYLSCATVIFWLFENSCCSLC